MELLQITAEYSNAVLVAILPYFSEVAQKLGLPVPTPITATQVFKFNCNSEKGQFGGFLILQNDFRFWFRNGHVTGFESPRSYAVLQDPALIPEFYGQPRMNRAEALAFARDSLRKLGYDLKTLYADLEPEVVAEPERIGTNVVPYYRFEWDNPLRESTAVDIEINAATKTVERLMMFNDSLWRAPPKISVAPPKPLKPPLEPGVSNALARALLPEFSGLAKQMELPLALPLTMDQVERVEFSDDKLNALKLTNGYWFLNEMEKVRGFFAPNSFYRRCFWGRCQPIEEYLGKWNMDEKQAIELARKAIRKAGYKDEQFETFKEPEKISPKQVFPYIIPRYLFIWNVPHPTLPATLLAAATVEVDADAKTVKYMELFDMRSKPPEYK